MADKARSLLVFQTIGGAFSVSAAQSAFTNRLMNRLTQLDPNINPQTVIATGATQIRQAFPADQVPSIVVAYMAGLKVAFALVVALAGVTCLLAFFIPRKRLDTRAVQGGGAV